VKPTAVVMFMPFKISKTKRGHDRCWNYDLLPLK